MRIYQYRCTDQNADKQKTKHSIGLQLTRPGYLIFRIILVIVNG